jgi:hypothetical protein
MFPLFAVVAVLSAGAPQSPTAPPSTVDSAAEQAGGEQAATPPSQPAPAAPTVDPDAIGVSLDRIQKAVSKPQAIKLTENRQVFRVEIFGAKPTIEDILGPDYLRGPVPYSGMSHQDFLNMVTPKDVQGYAAFSNRQGMVVAATSIALQWALQKALDKYKAARNERAKEAASKEVQDALDALRKARREAGLPDK